ncbi:hypothetical protein K435DRAFT_642027 [Dendrothele bispora CBS 962.96]|uniref:F-box domain-containing protein n=1 Tax=Dendrothele bispora (strain CBS 962.96) TaxID=1314807 RepID=A0A4S8MY65_DENBC|nr:hypothetical protein K435DRAFT_642027 [Dendrothele bispora CBS 962.96]
MVTFDSLPVELIADILSELDLESLIRISYLSRRLRNIVSDPSLNPWRRPILRDLYSDSYRDTLKHLSIRSTVPRQNWIEILSLASPNFILHEATLPNLRAHEWEECFSRRFLPGWRNWVSDSAGRAAFTKFLSRIWHRSRTSCTSDEAWTRYIVLNRNGSANELEASSRNFSPLSIFNEMKHQNDLTHLETRVRYVVQLQDVRIIALGTLNSPRSTLTVNPNAHSFLHPPGITRLLDGYIQPPRDSRAVTDHGVYPLSPESPNYRVSLPSLDYEPMLHPLPALPHANYPWYTPGGEDKRWLGSGEVEEEGLKWVGGLMQVSFSIRQKNLQLKLCRIVAQLITPKTRERPEDRIPLQDLDLVLGPGRSQYASFIWDDLWAIAPWMEERITRKINGPGLGL